MKFLFLPLFVIVFSNVAAEKFGDIVFVFETSEIMGYSFFNKTKERILLLAGNFTISQYQNRFGVCHFSSPDERSSISANFPDINGYGDLQTKVNGIKWIDTVGISDIELGLQLANRILTKNSGKTTNKKIVVLFARGNYDHAPTCCPDPVPIATEIRKNAAILAVEIPVRANDEILGKITGKQSYVFKWDNFYSVYPAIESIIYG